MAVRSRFCNVKKHLFIKEKAGNTTFGRNLHDFECVGHKLHVYKLYSSRVGFCDYT